MTIHDASINKALAAQDDLIGHGEHCSVDHRLLAAVGIEVGRQVRIRRSAEELALYTVSEARDEPTGDVVRMGSVGRQRLGTTDGFPATIDSRIPHPTMSEHDAETAGELVERLDDDGASTGLIVIAPHGGDIERHTDDQAERVASRLGRYTVSSWRAKGWRPGGGAFDRWHITSTDIDPVGFPALQSVMSRGFAHAVAFHGFGADEILIGGTAPAGLKDEIRAAIAAATTGSDIVVHVAGPDERYGGDDPRNIVNRLTARGANGVQIEQSLEARSTYGGAIADAVAAVYERRLRPAPTSWPATVWSFLGGLVRKVRRVIGRA